MVTKRRHLCIIVIHAKTWTCEYRWRKQNECAIDTETVWMGFREHQNMRIKYKQQWRVRRGMALENFAHTNILTKFPYPLFSRWLFISCAHCSRAPEKGNCDILQDNILCDFHCVRGAAPVHHIWTSCAGHTWKCPCLFIIFFRFSFMCFAHFIKSSATCGCGVCNQMK